MNLMTMFIMTLILSVFLIVLSFWLPQMKPDTEKLSPYECGFDPLGTARLPFSLRFFLIAILFLLFDLEIALLLPTPWAINFPSPTTTILWTSTIISLLTVGLIYEWTQGGLDWAE
uniref:NADH-ubiquinone oxidoreductase chain 3 n=1 Tax=Acanthodactylus guineensis TaxID=1855261 RepID=A0A8A3WNZ8_9SAUR|nr:NADH dehydrogenase subunit 3 [Acanthodactylus guineensis]QTA72688.1 NADH dehydrogenase subunit 3 [Acanthodactylus guineensis]